MKIYTKQGDGGKSVLFDGTRVAKNHLRLETYGTVDELNSHLGLAIVSCADAGLKGQLVTLQGQLLKLGSDLATPVGSKNEAKVERVSMELVEMLERWIDEAEERLPKLKRFILPGGTETAARLHVARTVCRRGERCLVTLMEAEEMGAGGISAMALVYVNRLSDLLFVFARLANHVEGQKDVEWNS